MSEFPLQRMRRLRTAPWIRDIIAENSISCADLILPIFATENKSEKTLIESLHDVYRYGEKELLEVISEAKNNGIKAIALFPVIDQKHKDQLGTYSHNEGNFLLDRIKLIKDKIPDIGIIADVALDPYTLSGHDGILDDNNYVDNDITNESLAKQALCLAKAGADVIAPSDMMDGRVSIIRNILEKEGLKNTMILSYAAKYSSNLYGPFRDAIGSTNNIKSADKNSYQMDFRNSQEALREIELDIKEGADMVMIKPANLYQDIIKSASDNFQIPIFAYQVSGEYSMLKFFAKNANIDANKMLMESLTSIKRSGASAIFTYGALEIAKMVNEINNA